MHGMNKLPLKDILGAIDMGAKDVWNELTDPNRKEWPLVGKRIETSDTPPGIADTTTRYYLPLKFQCGKKKLRIKP